jgi:branched-chain amino acid transport system substrate-binding protein
VATLVAAGALVTSVACARRAAAPTGDGSVALGVGALPGRPGYEGMQRGLELAVARLNEGHSVTFRMRLPAAGATSVVRIAEQLRSDPSVVGVIGHPESGNTLEALPIYADAEHNGADPVVVVSPTASSPRLSGISPWFFRVAPSDDNAAQFVARWVLDSLKSLSAAVIYRNDSYGREWSNTFSREFEKHAGIVVERDPYLTGITEWTAYAQLIARRHPDVLLFPGDAADAVELLRALKEAHVNIPFVGGDGTEGMRTAPEAAGARFVAFFRPERATSGEGQLFLKRYRAAYHDEPDMFAALSYDAALAIGRSVLAGARTRLAVKEALERLGHGTAPIEGVVGPIAFERNHDIAARSVVVTTIGVTP